MRHEKDAALEPVPQPRAPANIDFARALLSGLRAERKSIPCRFLYDARGSELFEEITRLPEYYPTRTETRILKQCAPDIAAANEPGTVLIEFGSGSSTKTEILLETLRDLKAYVPLDISPAAISEASERLTTRFPELRIDPVIGDFSRPVKLPAALSTAPLLGFFPGSTIGNLQRCDAIALLRNMASILGREAHLVIGIDLKKDEDILLAAYNDAQGVTAAFNLNLLARINHELGADFDTSGFAHEARWNAPQSRIEMHLVSQRSQRVTVRGQGFDFEPGETIRTEISRKFDRATLADLAAKAGWHLSCTWQDARDYFCVAFLE